MAEIEEQLAIEACLRQNLEDLCRLEIKTRHGACFDFHYSGADLYGSPNFDRTGYRACLEAGFESYIAEVRQVERLEREARDALLH
jgi:hypothetical protein